VTLTAEDGLDVGIANTVYLSFKASAGGGSASVGTTKLTSTPALFSTNASGSLTITYTAPASLPSSGQDVITASDAAKTGSTEKNTDSYSFASATPVISIGNVNVVEGDQNHRAEDHPRRPPPPFGGHGQRQGQQGQEGDGQ